MKLLYRILSGKIMAEVGGKLYIVYPLPYERKYMAECFYEETLEELLQSGCLSKNDIAFKLILFKEKLRMDYEEELKKLGQNIENMKVELYELVKEKADSKEKRDEINKASGQVSEILGRLHQKDNISAEGMAELEKTKYILRHSLKKKVDESTLEKIIYWISKNYIKEEDYRKIARSNIFSNIMNAGRPFKNKILTDEQITLMYWYKFYSGVYGHQERPFDWVIDDDLALDGWCILQNRKNKQKDSENYVESRIKSAAVNNSQEIFIPRKPGTDMSKEIYNANDDMGKMLIKAKLAAIEKGKLDVSSENKLNQRFGVGK